MLLSVYSLASLREVVVEVTVEDPAPGFQSMRDKVDCNWLLSNYASEQSLHNFCMWFRAQKEDKEIDSKQALIPDVNVSLAAKALKLTEAQLCFVCEALQYSLLPSAVTEINEQIEMANNVLPHFNSNSMSDIVNKNLLNLTVFLIKFRCMSHLCVSTFAYKLNAGY